MSAKDKMLAILLLFGSLLNGAVWGIAAAAVMAQGGALTDKLAGLAFIVAIWGIFQMGGVFAFWAAWTEED